MRATLASIQQHSSGFLINYEAYSESKYSFVVKTSSNFSYKLLLLSDSTSFKIFFNIFAAGTEQKLWNSCRHAHFRWHYAPNHHSPNMDAHFAHHHARSTCPSLNIRTLFLTIPSLIALSPYTWQIWWWISLCSTFLAYKKRITEFTVGGQFNWLKNV